LIFLQFRNREKPLRTHGRSKATSLVCPSIINPMKPIRIKPVKPVALPKLSSLGKPKANGGFDKRYATGLGRTIRQQIADQNLRRWF
jgi:hypothetical protein